MNILDKIINGMINAKGGGGGGSSGKVGYPTYMEEIHHDWLDQTGTDTISDSITGVMNSALAVSPWTTKNAYDPDTPLAAALASVTDMQDVVDLLSSGTGLDALISSMLDTARLTTAVTAYEADLDARLTSDILPRFQAGMRDINAVQSSAFVIGRALIEENQDRQVASYSANIRLKAFSDDLIRLISLKLEYQRWATHLTIESNRIKIVAKKEENDVNMEIDSKDATWDLSVFQYGSNVLGAIGGGVLNPDKPSVMQSMLGGALSGAAAGAMVGGAPGAAIGGVLGAASAFL